MLGKRGLRAEIRSQRRESETMGIISGVWFSEQQAIRAEERASDDQREKEIAYFNFYI